LQLDQCEEHGVWRDGGELDAALASALPNPQLRALLAAMRPRSDD
jgi:Zn-finger nucleic acid-binding protein